jgi:hypothetical protein
MDVMCLKLDAALTECETAHSGQTYLAINNIATALLFSWYGVFKQKQIQKNRRTNQLCRA